MSFRAFCAAAVIVCCFPYVGWAGPREDLANGRQALEAGDLDRAVGLLAAAAEALPDSVDAKLALADCHLQLGRLEEALAGFRTVLQLSPNHPRAKRIVTALTAQKSAFGDRLTAVRTLMKLRAFASAEEVLKRLVTEPLAPTQRNAARMLLAESQLWSGSTSAALRDALLVAQDSRAKQLSGPARVLAALALVTESDIQSAALAELLNDTAKLSPEWSARAELARLAIDSRDPTKVAAVSARLSELMPNVPPGHYREALFSRFSAALLDSARHVASEGDRDSTIVILWPMFSREKLPGKEAVLKAAVLKGGWLDAADIAGKAFAEASQLLAKVSETSFAKSGDDNRLLHYWLAGELIRQAPEGIEQQRAGQFVALAAKSANAGRTVFDRQASTVAMDANVRVNPFDALALVQFGQANKLDPSCKARGLSRQVIERYAGARKWAAAVEAVRLYHSALDSVARQLAVLRMTVRQATSLEDQIRTTRPQLGEQLAPQMKAALGALVESLKAAPLPRRGEFVDIAESLVERYTGFGRFDLAEAVVDACKDPLADWAIWMRAGLLRQQADRALSQATSSELLAAHTSELQQIRLLLDQHPTSSYIAAAVQRIEQIALAYAQLGGWPVSRQIIKQNEAALAGRPGRGALLQAATHLGELDADRGLMLFGVKQETPQSKTPYITRQRQDEAANASYAILKRLAKDDGSAAAGIASQARSEMLWLVGYFENAGRTDRANAIIAQFVEDRPDDIERVALEFRAVSNLLEWAARPAGGVTRNLAWLKSRDILFGRARESAADFIQKHAGASEGASEFVHRAQRLIATSYERQSNLIAAVNPVRAGGLLVQSAKALSNVQAAVAARSDAAEVPNQLWKLVDRLQVLGQVDQAIQILQMIQVQFADSPLASKSVLRIAELHAEDLANPLKAVETLQVYLSMTDDAATVRPRIFEIASRLAAEKRYLESMHVYKVFIENFPDETRVAEALAAIGRFHQINADWQQAIATYERIANEHPQAAALSSAKLAIAECRIHLGQWSAARRVYEEFATATPARSEANTARSRIEVLKTLERYETLLAGDAKNPNHDDARFQVGRLVLEKLENPARAVLEFRRVIEEYPQSELADDARLAAGRALLALNRLDAAREALLEVPVRHPGSPLADDALFLAAESIEKQARKLAGTSAELLRAESFTSGQRAALIKFTSRAGNAAGDPVAASLDAAVRTSLVSGATADRLFCQVCEAESQSETEGVLRVANRQARINEAYREAVVLYGRAAMDYPLGDSTDASLLSMARILENELKELSAAMAAYQQIVKLFPGTPVAEDAVWRIAEYSVQQKKHTAAIAAYRDFIRNYPASSRVADAQFGLAQVMERMGRWVDAMDAYETFRQKFSKHPKATLALKQINWIKTYRK